jgi:hypothetical protein
MTDNSIMQRRLEGENMLRSNATAVASEVKSPVGGIAETGINTIEQVSLEAVINVLLQRGVCTEAELIAEEDRLRSLQETMTNVAFTPVHIPNDRHHYSDPNLLRRWAAKSHWSRKLGSKLFGWKWHRKKRM